MDMVFTVKELREKLSQLNGEDSVIIKENQIIFPVKNKIYKTPTLEEFAKAVNKFTNTVYNIGALEDTKKEENLEDLLNI